MTQHATEQAFRLDLDIYDVAAILEGGYDCERSRRKPGIRERCSRWRRSWIRVVASLRPSGHTDGENAWIITAIKPTEEP